MRALRKQNDDLSDRLAEFQTQVEVAAEALTRKDVELLEFISRLHETMGGIDGSRSAPKNEAEALDDLRDIREGADQYMAVLDVINGVFDADEHLLKRMACAAGCSQWDADTVIKRVGYLAAMQSTNAGLQRELAASRGKVEELEEERDEDSAYSRLQAERNALAEQRRIAQAKVVEQFTRIVELEDTARDAVTKLFSSDLADELIAARRKIKEQAEEIDELSSEAWAE